MAESERLARRREDILAAALAVFSARGYSQATVEEVAGKAGVAKGSIYNYFPSKKDLFVQSCSAALARDEEASRQIVEADVTAGEKLNRLIDLWYDGLERHREISRLILEFWATAAREQEPDGRLSSAFAAMYDGFHDRVAAILAEGAGSGELTLAVGPQPSASLLMAALQGLRLQHMMGLGTAVDAELLDGLKLALARAMAPGSSGEERSDGEHEHAG